MGLFDSLAIGTIVFVPLVITLYYILSQYAYPQTKYTYFNGQKIMMAIAGGMVVGLIISLGYRFFPPYYLQYAIFFAFIEELIRLVILNSPWFQMKFDSVFYGAAIGGGTATMIISGIAYTSQYWSGAGDFWSPFFICNLILFSFAACLLNVANGAMIGYGCGKGMIWTYAFRAIAAHIIFSIALIGIIYPDQSQVGIFYYPSIIGVLLVSIILFIYVYTKIIGDALPENLKKQRRREILAMAREKRYRTDPEKEQEQKTAGKD
jgi:hypothetical protein